MFKFRKTIKISYFFVVLCATITAYDLNLVSAREQSSSSTSLNNQNLFIKPTGIKPKISRGSQFKPTPTPNSQIKQQQIKRLLVADSNIQDNNSDFDKSKLQLTELISRSFFLIFFIPCGIFYPLFLFYRKLLGVDQKELDFTQTASNKLKFLEDDYNYPQELNLDVTKATESVNVSSATVSKLQIAFSPQALKLRQKLVQISSSADLNQDQDIVDLMCKTVLALVSHQDWTHVNYTSSSLPLDQVKAEFNLISQTERKKCINRNLSLANRSHQANRHHSSQGDDYRYVVVTLILCTTHDSPLFGKIHTEEQLIDELAKLSKMRRESLLKFELLWNPQQETIYLNNDQLLTEYSDMIRLL
ncbi:MAG: DUF1517 domain-containing protein [Cyanobacteria bacterium P01_A01_bin.40]